MVISVSDVHKKFRSYQDKNNELKGKLLFHKRNEYKERWVLNGVSFQAERGESIGLIGENGCGKSTMLKLMSRIIYPDMGSIEINGRVSSLIELGAGFHPHMSGRENIFTNASIFGLSKREIEKRVQAIIDFSELGWYIDNPVRTYSTGMYMRLAFSVAINVDADVLLIDEILAVGDANFQAKCFERLRELKAAGVTTVIVTHDMNAIERFCTQALWINDGKIAAGGGVSKVIDAYLAYMNEKNFERLSENRGAAKDGGEENINGAGATAEESQEENGESEPEGAEVKDDGATDANAVRFGLKYVEIEKAQMFDKNGAERTVFRSGEQIKIVIKYKANKKIDNYVFGFAFATLENNVIAGTNTMLDGIHISRIKESGTATLVLESVNLNAGKYILHLAIEDENGTPMDYCRDFLRFNIVTSKQLAGIVNFPHEWVIEQ